MSFAIVAEFPLGAYRGSVGSGQLDPWPSTARLHAALLAAAGQGTRAVERDGALAPSAGDEQAIAWLESHPPDGLVLPTAQVVESPAVAYRDLGVLSPKMRGTKRRAARDHAAVRLAGSVMWVWESAPPKDVAAALSALCPDVPYLGRAASPVRLRTAAGDREPTHRRRVGARRSDVRSTDVELLTPREGRMAALVQAHGAEAATPPPRGRADQARTDESEARRPTVETALGRELYTIPAPTGSSAPNSIDAPWPVLHVLPISGRRDPIPVERRVAWCVALHRALISRHGDGAPTLLTGRYDPGTRQPANRVAIQLVDRSPEMAQDFGTKQAFVVAVPRDATREERALIADLVDQIRVVRSAQGSIWIERDGAGPVTMSGSGFWRLKSADERTDPSSQSPTRWRLATPAVPDVHLRRDGTWTLPRGIALSVGLVFRDRAHDGLPAGASRMDRLRAAADWALRHELVVHDAHRLETSAVQHYVHRVAKGALVEPYYATIDPGAHIVDQGLFLPIGQSRHLGGGLLVPDVEPGQPAMSPAGWQG